MMSRHFLCCLIAFALGTPLIGRAQGVARLTPPSVGGWGVSLTDQDRSVRPGDDFYRYQNGGWLARTELRSNQQAAAYWADLRRLAPRQLIALLESLAADSTLAVDSPEAKGAAFYRAFLDETAVEARGIAPVEPELAAIRAVRTRSELAGVIGRTEGPGTIRAPGVFGPPVGRSPFVLSIAQDQRDPGRYAVQVGQGGLMLPGPEYYLETQFADVRAAYAGYIETLLTMVGWPDAAAQAGRIVEFETQVARVSWPHESIRDPVRTYNPMSMAELRSFAPGFDWRAFFDNAGLPTTGRVVIDARDAFPKIAAIFAATPLEVLQARQAFAAADRSADFLNAAMATAAFKFSSTLAGNGAFHAGGAPRNLRAEQTLEATMGDILSALYVARYASSEARARAEEMAAGMTKALAVRLAGVSWMDGPSRSKALAKLRKMRVKIGFPDRFDNYRGVSITDQDLFGNVTRAARYNWERQVARLKQPVDRAAWTLAPEYPNYNYDLTTNTVEIPASLLQPPFFDLTADPAVNYGAVGSQIGQVIVMAFTGRGSPYDGDGRLRPWLAAADTARYAALAGKVSDQYSLIEPLPGIRLKGPLLVDEAISDLGGVLIALDAYHASLAGRDAALLDGYTGDQRFFLGRAQMWRAKFSPTFVRNQTATGFNAPPFVRVNGPLPNVDAWYEAFGVRPGDGMYLAPADRVRIW